MKWQRCSTFTPGHAVSTMNAVICRFSFPFTTLDGVRAITTRSSALVPLVPQLLAIEHPRLAVRRRDGGRLHRGRVGADARLCQRKRRDRALRETREVLLLLSVGTEELQRLGHADRLMRREERGHRSIDG